jgi:hypothetical protein
MINAPLCTAMLDRWRFAVVGSTGRWQGKRPSIPGFHITRDSFVRQQTKVGTYGRVRSLENPKTGTKVYLQYQRKHGWLQPMLVTVVANDATGILLPDSLTISTALGPIVTRLMELALDFSAESGVNKDFVLKHALFGKSRPAHDPRFPDQLQYGTRHSAKFVRVYPKQRFRVELELHRGWEGLPTGALDLHKLPLNSDDIRFVDVDWRALDAHLARKSPSAKKITADVRRQYNSIHQLLTFLSAKGVNNPHLFLRTSEKDGLIWKAFADWRRSFRPKEK